MYGGDFCIMARPKSTLGIKSAHLFDLQSGLVREPKPLTKREKRADSGS